MITNVLPPFYGSQCTNTSRASKKARALITSRGSDLIVGLLIEAGGFYSRIYGRFKLVKNIGAQRKRIMDDLGAEGSEGSMGGAMRQSGEGCAPPRGPEGDLGTLSIKN